MPKVFRFPSPQIYIFYGTRSNAEFVIHNGFFFEDNAHDRVKIKLWCEQERTFVCHEGRGSGSCWDSCVSILYRNDKPDYARRVRCFFFICRFLFFFLIIYVVFSIVLFHINPLDLISFYLLLNSDNDLLFIALLELQCPQGLFALDKPWKMSSYDYNQVNRKLDRHLDKNWLLISHGELRCNKKILIISNFYYYYYCFHY